MRLDDGETWKIGEGEVLSFSLYSGMELSQETLEELRVAAQKTLMKNRAVSLLTNRPYSVGELRDKLRQRGGDGALAEEIALWAQEIGLINEEGYARQLARMYEARGYGAYKIKEELYRRKIPRDLWEDVLAELSDPREEINAYLRRHLGSREPKAVKKVADALARRGFSWSQVSEAIRAFEFSEEFEE